MACQLGYLYNREPVLQALKAHLVDGLPLPALAAHITSLKDLTTLRLDAAAEADARGCGDASASAGDFRAALHVRFACPLTGASRRARLGASRSPRERRSMLTAPTRAGLQLNGRFRFVALRPSGVVVSERALKSVRVLRGAQGSGSCARGAAARCLTPHVGSLIRCPTPWRSCSVARRWTPRR